MKDSKYIVYKLTESGDQGDVVPDAVVIRGQDIFAASTFFNYSNQAQTALEILTNVRNSSPEMGEMLQNLQNVADYFHELGVWASKLSPKLPD